jgi:hypothetical protein
MNEPRATDADPRAYSIVVRLENIEGEFWYAGRVTELPDVAVYFKTSCEAYAGTLECIESLQGIFREEGRAFPEPVQYRPEHQRRNERAT